MNQLCLLTDLTTSEMAAWFQAVASFLAIVSGFLVMTCQMRYARQEQNNREARMLEGIALLLSHLKELARNAWAEKKKLERLPVGDPAEPSTIYQEFAKEIHHFSLEAAHGEIPIRALLIARRISNELLPFVNPGVMLDTDPDCERIFNEHIKKLDSQVRLLQKESKRLISS